ncbi:uncharacterized protein LOC134819403 isoform X3 [Bolinopsis microptera]|uniref:uncharacterized protein LOC134819403 isoform X3 n=1 Tax=Bolinopsis microptera TaxID=2820187 RepID=UPI003078AD39
MVHVLISADSDVNSRAFNGMVPLHMAAQCGHEDVIDLLIKEKADKLTRDNNGKLPAFYLPSKTSDRIKELLAPPPPLTTKVRHESLSQGIRRRMTAMSRSRKVSGSFTRPALTRRPSTSSLDDTIKRTRSNSETGSVSKNSKKQYMSGIKFIRSSFRSKKGGRHEKGSRTGSPDLCSPETPVKFVRPRPFLSNKSNSLPPLPPLSRSYKNFRASIKVKKTKSASAVV